VTRARALVLVDGEHYPPVVRSAIAAAGRRDDVVAAVVLGGVEKLSGDPDYGVQVERVGDDRTASVIDAARRHDAGLVVDLSDEPVLSTAGRLRLAAHVLAAGLRYEGPDFSFAPPARDPVGAPAIAVTGTGKRIGKTAVSGYLARLLDRWAKGDAAPTGGREIVVVAMGRGGPPEPDVVDVGDGDVDVEALLERARGGAHAASDYLEDAVLARVTTVGCRRCGGGLAGMPYVSNVPEGARLALERDPGLVLLEGSGAALPPLAADRTVLVTSAASPAADLLLALNPVRVLLADLVVVTMAEPPLAEPGHLDELRAAVAELRPEIPVIATVLRPVPAGRLDGGPVAYFTTAPESMHERLAEALAEAGDVEVAAVSGALSDRERLREDLDRPEVRDAETYVVEIKAAAIDVVAETAAERGARVVFCDNRPQPIDGEDDLDAALVALAEQAVAAHA
jgi:cyclic 2,3-diphosphoglycerate synthetase